MQLPTRSATMRKRSHAPRMMRTPILGRLARALGLGPSGAPVVSVIISTYNWSSALRCAIQSALLQTFQDFEILVVGDGCSDDTADIVAAFRDERIRWHNLERNHGSQYAPNNFGIAHAAGEWIAYLGQDDIWYPTHLEAIMRAARTTGADVVTSIMILYGPPHSGLGAVAGVFQSGVCTKADFVPPTALAHRKSLIDVIGLWPRPDTSPMPVDNVFFLAAINAAKVSASTNELTTFKFNAAWRRDSYKLKPTYEQEAMLRRIESGIDFRHEELLYALQGFASAKFSWIVTPNVAGEAAGSRAKINSRFKGAEPRYAPADLRRVRGR